MTTDPIAQLSALDTEAFADFVCDNLPDTAPAEVWEALLSPELLRRTKDTLTELARDLQTTTAEMKATLPDRAYGNWYRTVGIPSQRDLGRRRQQVRDAARRQHAEAVQVEHNEGRKLAAQFAAAIAQHRAACAVAGLEPEPHDKELWSLLTALPVRYAQGVVTPAWLLEAGIWRAEVEA